MNSQPPVKPKRNSGLRGGISQVTRSSMSPQHYVPELAMTKIDESNSVAHSSGRNSFRDRDFQLPELEFNNGTDLGAIVAQKHKLKRVSTLKGEIWKETMLLNALDELEQIKATSEELPLLPGIKSATGGRKPPIIPRQRLRNESKLAKRNRLINHQARTELDVLRHVIQRKPGEHKDELKKHTKHLKTMQITEKDGTDFGGEDNQREAGEGVEDEDEEEEEEEEEEISTLDHPKLDSIHEKLEDLRQEAIELWCKKHDKVPGAKYTNHDKRMLRKWFKELDFDGSGEVSVEELQDPMLSAGLLKTREQVVRVLSNVDKNNTMGIDFEEFLQALTGNKLADSSKLAKLQEMSNNEFGFTMDTLITAERRHKILKSVLKQCEHRQGEIDKLYKKIDKDKLSKRERELLMKELEDLEEAQSKSVHLHQKYISALDNVIVDKKVFYVQETLEKDRQAEERQRLAEASGDNIGALIAARYGNNIGEPKYTHNKDMSAGLNSATAGIAAGGGTNGLKYSTSGLNTDSIHSYLSLANKYASSSTQMMDGVYRPRSTLPNPYSIYGPPTIKKATI